MLGSQDRSPLFRLLTEVPSPYDLDVGGTLNSSSLTNSRVPVATGATSSLQKIKDGGKS